MLIKLVDTISLTLGSDVDVYMISEKLDGKQYVVSPVEGEFNLSDILDRMRELRLSEPNDKFRFYSMQGMVKAGDSMVTFLNGHGNIQLVFFKYAYELGALCHPKWTEGGYIYTDMED